MPGVASEPGDGRGGPLRWLIVTDDWPPLPGGVATYAAQVAAGLAARGHAVRVLCRARPALAQLPGVRVTGVPGPSFGRHGHRWLALRGLRAVAEADAVLATTWVVASTIRHLRPRRLHVLAHGSDVTRPPRSSRRFAAVWEQADRRWAVSHHLAGVLADRGVVARVLPAPVDPAAFPVPAGTGARWGFVGRATPLKGGDRFVRWVAEAGVQGVVVGDGPELPAWRALARQLEAPVRFVGATDRLGVQRELAVLDLLVLCPRAAPDGSGAEGFGLAAVEAAALGVPAVGSAVGGVPEAIGPGLVVSDPDDPRRAVGQITRWWSPLRGRDAWAWCRATHGRQRTVDRLLGACDR